MEYEATFIQSMHLNSVNGEAPEFTGDQSTKLTREFNNDVRSSAVKHMDTQQKERFDDNLKL